MRKSFLCVLLFAIAAAGTAPAQAPSSAEKSGQKQILRPEGAATNLPFSPGVIADDLVYIAGQGTRNPKTGQHPATWEEQVQQSIENIRVVLKAGGMDLANIISCHAYFADLNDRPRMNKVYGSLFNVNPPVRTAVEVGAMPDEARLEMTCIAARELEARKVPGRGTVQVGNWIFTSGTTGGVQSGKMAEDFEGQAKQPGRAIQIVGLGPTTHVEVTLLAADPSVPRKAVRKSSVLAGNTLFVSEQSAPGATIEDQVTGTMKRLQQTLSAAKMKMSDVVTVNVYLKDLADFPRMNAIYRRHFAENPPARTTVQVKQASPGTLVTISCVAVK
jgi:2-iminobutanoate/2-iminopropanoate deaminase